MNTLTIPQNTIKILQKHNFRFRKKYGQNFLTDASVLDKIIEAADIQKDDCILEIGPGIGVMTQYLAQRAGKVIAVEIDKMLIPILEETLASYGNVTVLHADILKTDVSGLADIYHDGAPIKVVANLPYYITTPIIMKLFEDPVLLRSVTIMVQKEVAMRMQTGPGTKDYGALSLAVQYYAAPEIITEVSPDSFFPRPAVESCVVRLTMHETPPVFVKDEKLMFALIRATFDHRRKTLVNSLIAAQDLNFTREKILQALQTSGESPAVRGETFTLEKFAALSDLLSD